MIETIYTKHIYPTYAGETALFKTIVVMLVIQRFGVVTLPKLQMYLWSLKNEENRNKLIALRKSMKITEAPWILDNDLVQVVTQCLCNHYIKVEMNKSGKISYALDFESSDLLQAISDTDLVKEIKVELETIGGLTDKVLEHLEFDF